LVLTCTAAFVIIVGQDLIQRNVLLTFLLPVIAAVVGNAGHQALAVTIRGIVLDEVRAGRVAPLLAREGAVGMFNGVILGAMVFVVVGLLSQFDKSASWHVGAVAGAALAMSMLVGTVAGSSIPIIMRRAGFDPAQSSAIFLIMITDGLSFSSLLALTWLML